MGISTNVFTPSPIISPCVSSAAAMHWWYTRSAHGLLDPSPDAKIRRSPAHPMRFFCVIIVSNSSFRSYRSAQIISNTRAGVRAGPVASSARRTTPTATVDTALYENRLHPLRAELPYDNPCCRVPPSSAGCMDAHSACTCSLTGTRVSVITLARADHRSIIASPYWLVPSIKRDKGPAARSSGPPVDATSFPIRASPCQNTAAASSMLSKKSSNEYKPPPHPPSTE